MMAKSERAVVHFETRRANKARWVKQAQRDGKPLAQWIEDTLNENSKPLTPRDN